MDPGDKFFLKWPQRYNWEILLLFCRQGYITRQPGYFWPDTQVTRNVNNPFRPTFVNTKSISFFFFFGLLSRKNYVDSGLIVVRSKTYFEQTAERKKNTAPDTEIMINNFDNPLYKYLSVFSTCWANNLLMFLCASRTFSAFYPR